MRTVGINTWRRLKRVGFSQNVPGYNTLLFSSVFTGDVVYGTRHRHDAVAYRCGHETNIGIVEAVFAHYHPSIPANNRMVLLRKLDQIDPGPTNSIVVTQFGNLRYKYCVSTTGYINTVLVHASCLIQPVTLVIDPYGLKQTHGLQKKFEDIAEDCQAQPSIRFFRVCRFNIYKRSQQLGNHS